MKKRELVMLAHTYNSDKDVVNGWYCSEKLDGQRALWLPWTRGLKVGDVGFANRARDHRDHIATGLWSRYGKTIFAPNWWLDCLPTNYILDGELYSGRGQFQTLRSCVGKLVGIDNEWEAVKYCVFDIPTIKEFYKAGVIRNVNYSYEFDGIVGQGSGYGFVDYDDVLKILKTINNSVIECVKQTQLPFYTNSCEIKLNETLKEVVGLGGEGLILRKPSSEWEPIRSNNLLKVKPVLFGEGVVVGWSVGIGKYVGMMGSLNVLWQDKVFSLSGFTDLERQLVGGGEMINFKVGDVVKFCYRELSDGGIPKEARYYRSFI